MKVRASPDIERVIKGEIESEMQSRWRDWWRASLGLMAIVSIGATIGLRETSRIRGPDSVPRVRGVPSESMDAVPKDVSPDKSESVKSSSTPKFRNTVVIAVVDTGLDLDSFDGKLWTNSAEVKNGLDDDGNGVVDDIHGWNFVTQSAEIDDTHGHGTHVSNLIAHVADSRAIEVMPLVYYGSNVSGAEALRNSIAALRYAIEKRVDIINYSGGGLFPSDEEKMVLAEADRLGILVVAAAGNEGSRGGSQKFYPANYGLSNIISVGAMRKSGEPLPESNSGTQTVDVIALGEKVKAKTPGGLLKEMTGTSQATAIVSGLAARIILEKRALGRAMSPEAVIFEISNLSQFDDRLLGRSKHSSKISINQLRRSGDQDPDSEAIAQLQTSLLASLRDSARFSTNQNLTSSAGSLGAR